MEDKLVSIAASDTGNYLVLLRENDQLGEGIFHWNHETSSIRKWGKGFENILRKAEE